MVTKFSKYYFVYGVSSSAHYASSGFSDFSTSLMKSFGQSQVRLNLIKFIMANESIGVHGS
jgi:hypothetical protein